MASKAHRKILTCWSHGWKKTKKVSNKYVYSDYVKSKKGIEYWKAYVLLRWTKTFPKKRRGLWTME